jgi:hypothetical protein
VRVVLVRDDKPRTRDRDDRGYGLPLVTTDLITPVEELVTRYARRWAIEVTFAHARQVLGVGQARNWTRQAVERTVPFGLFCLSLVTVWYATAGHAPADVAERRSRSRWYVTKTEPSFDDMTIKLRRVIIAAKYRPQALDQVTPEETRTVLAAWGRSRNMTIQKRETRAVREPDVRGDRTAFALPEPTPSPVSGHNTMVTRA